MKKPRSVIRYEPGHFEIERHYYPRVLNTQLHPMVRNFFNLGNERIAMRYHHLNPAIKVDDIRELLSSRAKHLVWSGSDLFCVVNENGVRRVVVIETNSCPSGQKSAPLAPEREDYGGYRLLLEKGFLPNLKGRKLPRGVLAVLYDKNFMEASGYAACMADLFEQEVYLVPWFADEEEQFARFTNDGILEILVDGDWVQVKAAFRYVTQKPWSRIPPVTKTFIHNPVLGCLAGGRNKLLAAKAYDLYNAQLHDTHMKIRTPETIWDVSLDQVPIWVRRMGGIAVVKNPYSNAGQGVYTITSERELDAFMALEHKYQRFIVQALIGNSSWSSRGGKGTLHHVGTVPDKKNRIFVADLRLMIGSGEEGFFPVAIYARRARSPLSVELDSSQDSWEMLGTNLSIKDDDGEWQSETERLMLMDNRDFNRLGLSLDDMIEAYLQTVLSTLAIDTMAKSLVSTKGRFKRRYFQSINPDANLVSEIC